MSEENKALVRRLVDEVINGGRLELVEELFAPELADRPGRRSAASACGRVASWSPGGWRAT